MDDRAYRKAFYPAVDVQQGIDPRQREYYVPIYERPEMRAYDLVPKLRDAIDFSVAESVQLLSGFRGCGKTSELLRLKGELEGLGYRVAYLDIEDFFNTRLPLDLALFPHALAAGFAAALDKDPARPPMRRFVEFLRRLRFDVTATVGTDIAQVEIAPVVRDDLTFAAAATAAFKTNRRTFREEFHAFFADVLAGLDAAQPVVLIVDSIDHWRGSGETFETVRESVDVAFTELADDLKIPNVHVIYTVPIYLDIPTLGNRQDVVNVKLTDEGGIEFEPGIAALRDVLARRAPDNDLARLISDADTRRLILASGGMFRDLLRLTRATLLEAQTLPADRAVLDRAEMRIREGYATTLSREQLDILKDVQRTHELFTSRERNSDEASLITLGAVLRYPNATKTWYAVHPLLRPLL
ncbi:MAG: hypothetical protein IPH27_16430 [Actinomycetales bacterium]|jgi:hypothetical protein|nr:hypothetical protein [Candidatus Phosphoribacter baldrii]MBK6956954.1 hypothetical protein [Candidatus Phosphoribacter baldrii]